MTENKSNDQTQLSRVVRAESEDQFKGMNIGIVMMKGSGNVNVRHVAMNTQQGNNERVNTQ